MAKNTRRNTSKNIYAFACENLFSGSVNHTVLPGHDLNWESFGRAEATKLAHGRIEFFAKFSAVDPRNLRSDPLKIFPGKR
jgi:hypothetical protein